MKQINATQERGVYDITGIVKSELRADDDDIWRMQETMNEHDVRSDAWQMQKEHMIRSEESSKKTEMRPNTKQLRKLMHDCMTLSADKIKDIASSEEENEKLYTRVSLPARNSCSWTHPNPLWVGKWDQTHYLQWEVRLGGISHISHGVTMVTTN